MLRFGLALGLLASLSFGFEVTDFRVVRGGALQERFDELTPSVLLDPQESVLVEFFVYREAIRNEPQGWTALTFQTAEGVATQVFSRGTLTNPGFAKGVFPLSLRYELAKYRTIDGGEWDTLGYAVRVSKNADPQTAKVFMVGPFSIGTEADRLADSTRLGLPIYFPEELPLVTATAPVEVKGSGGDAPWVVDLPGITPPPLPGVKVELAEALLKALAEVEAQKIDAERDAAKAKSEEAAEKLGRIKIQVVEKDRTPLREIYYLSNRVKPNYYQEGKSKWWTQFDFVTGETYPAVGPRFGKTKVHVPIDGRKIGANSIPMGFPGKWGDDRIFLTEDHQVMELESMVKELWNQDVLYIVHGFNTDFQEALIRAAQIKADMQWLGPVVVIDWPSRGLTAAYSEDRKMVENDNNNNIVIGNFFFLMNVPAPEKGLTQETRGKRHIINHSMGNEVFNRVTAYLASRGMLRTGLFNQIIFAAPDVAIADFEGMVKRLRMAQVADGLTLYFCRGDVPVISSRFINLFTYKGFWETPTQIRNAIEGRAGITPHYYEGVDIINTDLVTSSLGSFLADWRHGYFASADRVVADIRYLLWYRLPAEKRRTTLTDKPQKIGNGTLYIVAP